MKPKRPLLRYYGGKWMIADWIISHFPAHRVYTESFGGGASILLRKSRSYAEIYNDMDDEIVNLFKVARDYGRELKQRIEVTPFSRLEYKLAYMKSDNPIEQAARTIIKSFMGFGSDSIHRRNGFRSDSKRPSTIPAHDWMNYSQALISIIDRLRGVVIERDNAIKIMKAHDSIDTLHYMDPPYLHALRKCSKEYRYEMTDHDHQNLLQELKKLKGMVILSGYENDLYNSILSEWKKFYKDTYAQGAKKRIETLWISPNCSMQENLF